MFLARHRMEYLRYVVGTITPTKEERDDDHVRLNGDIFSTDGSKSLQDSGVRIYDMTYPNGNISLRLGRQASLLQAEIYANLTCAWFCNEKAL